MKKTLKPEEYTRKYYEDFCRRHEDFLESKVPSGYATTLMHLKPQKNEKILDVGCGRGEIIKECSKVGSYAVGIDYSVEAVKISKENGNENIIRAGTTQLPFKNEIFDKIVFMEVLEHLSDTNLTKSLKELKRTLKNRGYLIGSTPNSWGWILKLLIKLCRLVNINVNIMTRGDPYHINVKNPLQIWKIFREEGLRIKLRTDIVYPPGYPYWKRIARKLLFFVMHIRWIAYKG